MSLPRFVESIWSHTAFLYCFWNFLASFRFAETESFFLCWFYRRSALRIRVWATNVTVDLVDVRAFGPLHFELRLHAGPMWKHLSGFLKACMFTYFRRIAEHNCGFRLGLRSLQQRDAPFESAQGPVDEYIPRNIYACVESSYNLVETRIYQMHFSDIGHLTTSQFHSGHHKEFCVWHGFFVPWYAKTPDLAVANTRKVSLESTWKPDLARGLETTWLQRYVYAFGMLYSYTGSSWLACQFFLK